MCRFVLKRIFYGVIVLFVISILTFLMLRIAPGGPFDEEKIAPPEIQKHLEEKYRLDLPLHLQYISYIKGIVLHGDLGPSFRMPGYTVNDIIKKRFPVTFILGIAALILAFFVGTSFGVIAAMYHNSAIDGLAMAIAIIGITVPNFVIAPLLILLFASKLHIVGIAFNNNLSTSILPVFVLALPMIAKIARLTRASLIETLQEDFIRTARAKGVSEAGVVVKHSLRIALLPVVSYLGPAAAAVTTGSIVVERIFAINGIGNSFFTAAIDRDYTLVMGLVLLYSVLLVLFNIVVDILYTYLDPRIRLTV